MATLNSTQRTALVNLISYLAFNHDLPIDERVVAQLDTIFGGTSGFPCPCGSRGIDLRSCLRDEPIRTFLRLLLAMNDDAGGALHSNADGVLAP